MKRSKRFHRLVLLGLLAALAAWPLGQVADARLAEPEVPETIQVRDGSKLFLVAHAVGVQIYACNAAPGGYRWDFVAPQAELFDGNGKLIGSHFGGPTWQAKDGSRVIGQRVDGVTVDPTAIPWLLLSAKSTAAGFDGDRFTGTSFIQRIATTGGLAPASAECNESTAGSTDEVAYTADYAFWKAMD